MLRDTDRRDGDMSIYHLERTGPYDEDALNQEGNVSLDEVNEELTTYFKCAGCDFPHLSEQQAINCCLPVQVFCCPTCGSFRYSEEEARECCR